MKLKNLFREQSDTHTVLLEDFTFVLFEASWKLEVQISLTWSRGMRAPDAGTGAGL